ncbi:MAG TPA: macro domain-containing protein [Thermodesulfobacteriota bacterium]|nr:macro domain-containing protein [Thermodesulfobacteriota bacterium]
MSGDKIIIEKGDITDFEGDAIVNAANTELILGSGVAGAIREKGGFLIQAECNKTGSILLGEAAITHAGDLNTKYVIHAAGMHLGGQVETEALKSCTLNSLKLADKFKIKTLAFPAIGTGVGGYPLDKCAEVMLGVVNEYLKSHKTQIEKIYFILFDDNAFNSFNNYIQQI